MINEILLGGMGLLSVAAVGSAVMQSSKQTKYLYANARVIARSSQVLDSAKIQQLSSCSSLSDLKSALKDTDYAQYLEDVQELNLKSFTLAIELGLMRAIDDMKKLAPQTMQGVLSAYTITTEASLIKTIFRSRFSNTDIDESLLKPIGTINPSLLNHLKDTKTIADMKVVLAESQYAPLFESEYNSIEEFDVALSAHVGNLINHALSSSKIYDKQAIFEVIQRRSTIKEILRLIKFRIRSLDKKEQKKLATLDIIDVSKAIDAENLSQFVECFAKTPYHSALSQALSEYEKHDDYYAFERELLSYHYDQTIKNELAHNIGPYPLISYITKKKRERRNLFIIAKAITSGLSSEETRRMIL